MYLVRLSLSDTKVQQICQKKRKKGKYCFYNIVLKL